MARLFVEHNGQRFEKKFRGKTAYYVDERGREVGVTMTKVLDQGTARAGKLNAVEATRGREPRARVYLTESELASYDAARRHYRTIRKSQPKSAQISEAARLARRRDIHMAAGMTFEEAGIAARGRYERG